MTNLTTPTALLWGDRVLGQINGQLVCPEAAPASKCGDDQRDRPENGASIHLTPSGDAEFLFTDQGLIRATHCTGLSEISRACRHPPRLWEAESSRLRRPCEPPCLARNDEELICASLAAASRWARGHHNSVTYDNRARIPISACLQQKRVRGCGHPRYGIRVNGLGLSRRYDRLARYPRGPICETAGQAGRSLSSTCATAACICPAPKRAEARPNGPCTSASASARRLGNRSRNPGRIASPGNFTPTLGGGESSRQSRRLLK